MQTPDIMPQLADPISTLKQQATAPAPVPDPEQPRRNRGDYIFVLVTVIVMATLGYCFPAVLVR